ncbi:hypothetical protein [Microcella sp.]|uniref:hypothetical protein n=1 Tax=Microcella sp. TaxID=1913979 RepID=UPI00256C2593|nr:hypothetical protein [Microcella sp.]MBX9470521.1 hypothetical protein [Microcella sp.]
MSLLPPLLNDLIAMASWSAVAALLLLVAVLALLATATERSSLVLPAIVVVGIGAYALLLGFEPTPPGALGPLIALGLALIGIVAGGPLATLVLAAATRGGAPDGDHGGIIVPVATGGTARTKPSTREVLRGGLTIGYLERVIVVAAVLVGRWELLAGLIAIKGLGRFRDLDAGAATERFIIGTLVSLTWAGLCGALIVLA